MKNYKFILLALALTTVFATACTFCVGSDCPEGDAVSVDVEDSQDLPTVSDYTITPEIEPIRDYPEPESDLASFLSPNFGMSFEYPSEFIMGEGLFKYWDNFTLTNPDDGAVFDIHVNPDGFGPFFPDRDYQVDENSDGSLDVIEVVEEGSELSDDERTVYKLSFNASNGNNYMILFSVEDITTEYQDAFEDFIESFRVL